MKKVFILTLLSVAVLVACSKKNDNDPGTDTNNPTDTTTNNNPTDTTVKGAGKLRSYEHAGPSLYSATIFNYTDKLIAVVDSSASGMVTDSVVWTDGRATKYVRVKNGAVTALYTFGFDNNSTWNKLSYDTASVTSYDSLAYTGSQITAIYKYTVQSGVTTLKTKKDLAWSAAGNLLSVIESKATNNVLTPSSKYEYTYDTTVNPINTVVSGFTYLRVKGLYELTTYNNPNKIVYSAYLFGTYVPAVYSTISYTSTNGRITGAEVKIGVTESSLSVADNVKYYYK
jgi:hypothetical protein